MAKVQNKKRAEQETIGVTERTTTARHGPKVVDGHSPERLTNSPRANEVAAKVPSHVLFRRDHSLIVWKPRFILNEAIVNEIVRFIETAEKRCKTPFNRFSDLSALDAVDLNFKFVFSVGLNRRLSVESNPPVKSAFYVTSPATVHYIKLHKLLTDYSPLGVRLFTDPAEAAKWLSVPRNVLLFQE